MQVYLQLPRRNSIEGRLCWQDADCWLSHRDVKYRFFCSILIDSDLENHVRFTVAHNVAKNAGRLTSVLLLGYTKRPAFLRMVLCKLYFWRMKMRMGQPVKSKWLRSLFSRNLLYGAPMYWGRLQKKANDGQGVGSWVIYLILMGSSLSPRA